MRTDIGRECLRAHGGHNNPHPAVDLYAGPTSPEPWSNIEHAEGPPLTVEEERAVLEGAVLEYVRIYPSTLPGGSPVAPASVVYPFPNGLSPPELLVWISHSPFPEMAKDQEVLRLFGKLIGLPSASRPKSQLDENSYTSEGGLVLDPALMGEGLGNMSGMGGDVGGSSASSSKNMRCDYVHPISRERCPKVFTRMFDMRRHVEAVHNTKVTSGYQCEDCEKRFSRSDALTRHKRSYCTKRDELLDDPALNIDDASIQNQDFPEYQPYQAGTDLDDYPDGNL
ncbi:hypothetical protein BDY24DRAFT_380220 [Mrakia frigida]|uniref:C2H2-type zinc finger protein n=1 Tax=Mrakia frigida TaxID=29902 RepID=UPI003FCC0DE0